MSQTSSQAISKMHDLLAKYSTGFPRHRPGNLPIKPHLNVVLLIGTRGGLGANILAQILAHKDVKKVYGLNRVHADGKTSIGRQADEFEWHNLPKSLASSPKLFLLEGDTSKRYFGLDPETYREISESVTGIFLNGWRVDFSSPLPAFEPVISGLRNIIDMALKSPQSRPPHLIFCSSVAILHNIDALPTPLLELEIQDPAVVVGQGYRESKYVSEKIIAAAAKQTTLPATIVRLGQLTGSLSGAWKSNEWFPLVVKSSQIMGCLPTDKRSLSFLPAQPAAIALVELMNSTVTIAHIVHPHPIPADTIMQYISKSLRLPIVSQSEWLHRLEASASKNDRKKNLAIRLLPFLQFLMNEAGQNSPNEAFNVPLVSSINAQRGAPSLICTKPLDSYEIQGWLDFWQRIGFLEGKKVNSARL